MAKCERREIKPEPPPVEFVLTLTDREVEALRSMLAYALWPWDEEGGRMIADIREALRIAVNCS